MFTLFKRTKIEKWEIDLLRNIFDSLPNDLCELFLDQINNRLHRGVLIGLSDIPGYVSLTFNPQIYKIYYNKNGRNFKYTNIKVFDTVSERFVDFEIYFSSGVVNGYRIVNNQKVKFDVHKIDTSVLKKVYLDNKDYDRISKVLTSDEKKKINPTEVFLVTLDKKDYYHLKDLEDGDFIAIDTKREVYKVTHDPFEILPINLDLIDIL